MRKTIQFVVALCAVLTVGLGHADGLSELSEQTYRQLVDKAGNIKLPESYRQNWTHLGSLLVADPKAPGHGFHDVYAQPQAVLAYRQTGKFPDGTVLVKEVRKVKSAVLPTGKAQWAGDINIWFVMIKDTQGRFKGNPHWAEGWGWALYEAKSSAINVSKSFREACKACHIPAKQTDWVFIGGYPTLAKP